MHQIEYKLKHNKFIQRTYIIVFSWFFRALSLFIKADPHQIIFQSLIGKNYGDSPRVLYDRIKNDPKFENYKFVWAFDEPDRFQVEGAKKVKLTSLSYYIETLKSGIWISNVSIERGLQYKPQSTIYLNTWHGVPIKLIGNAQKTRSDYDYSDVDFMCYSCDFERNIFIRDFLIKPEALVKCGMPRNDQLYHLNKEEIANFRREFNIPDGKKIILYAPTWRDSADGGNSYQIAPPLNIQYWKEQLGNDYVLLFRMHHLTTQMMGIEFDDFVRDVSHVQEINKLMAISDVLISDYSATIFDYSILERPIISFAYDYEDYSEKRGFYEKLTDILPDNVFTTEQEIIAHIQNMEYEYECEKARSVKQHYIDTEGKATEICMDYLLKIVKE